MSRKFILAGLTATVVNLLLIAGLHFLFLKDVFAANPPISEEFHKQLIRPPDQLIGWAMVVTSLAMGFFIATVIHWSGAKTFASGLKNGFVVAFLFWSSINFGLYASSNHFSLTGVLADLVSSVTAMTISAAFTAWIFGLGKKQSEK